MSCKRAITRSAGLVYGILLAVAASSAHAQFVREYCFYPADPGPCECHLTPHPGCPRGRWASLAYDLVRPVRGILAGAGRDDVVKLGK